MHTDLVIRWFSGNIFHKEKKEEEGAVTFLTAFKQQSLE